MNHHHDDSTPSSFLLWQQAHEEARQLYQDMIARVLRHVSLSFLLLVGETQILASSVERATAFGRCVARHWSQALEQQGHVDLALWIRQVALESNNHDFWSFPMEDGNTRMEQDFNQETNGAQQEEEAAATRHTCSENSFFLTPHARLKACINTISNVQSFQVPEQTNWPLDWSIVEQACRDLEPRLHSSSTTRQVQYEVVPKELVNEITTTLIEPISLGVQQVLEKKRKRQEQTTSTTSRKEQKRQKLLEQWQQQARPPSTLPSEFQIDYASAKQSFSQNDLDTLNAYLHTPECKDGPTIRGSLVPLPDKHHRKRRLSEKTVLRDERRTPVSRVVRARDAAGAHYLELDMEHVVVEQEGRLYAFCNMECSLRDATAICNDPA